MQFIQPKNRNAEKVDWEISEKIRSTVKYYSEYTEYGESEVVEVFLANLLEDKKFLEWIESRRNNKRIVKQLEIEDKVAKETGTA